MLNEKILSTADFELMRGVGKKEPGAIVIGDPSYFDLDRDDLVYVRKFKDLSEVKATVHLDEIETTYGDFTIKNIEASIILHTEEVNISNLSLKGFKANWVRKVADKKQMLLGCDTATFAVSVGDSYDEVSTGADGYYGSTVDYLDTGGEWIATYLNLSFPEYMTMEQVIGSIKYWFN